MTEVERLLAKPDQIPLDSVPYGLLNRVSDAFAVKDAEIERLQTAITDCIAMIDNCAGVPTQPDSLVQMVRERLGRKVAN